MSGFRASPSLERDLLDDAGVRAAVNYAAGEIHKAALRRASRHVDTGNYVRNLKQYPPDDDCVAHVVAGAYYSNWVEYGTCSRRSDLAPTPCPHPEPKKTGIHPQFIMLGALMDVSK